MRLVLSFVPLVDVDPLGRYALKFLDPSHEFGVFAGEVQDCSVIRQLLPLCHALLGNHQIDNRLGVRMQSHAHCLSLVHAITPIIGHLRQLSILCIVDIFGAYCYTVHTLYEVTPYVPSVSGKRVMFTLLPQSIKTGVKKKRNLGGGMSGELLAVCLVIGTALFVAVVVAAVVIEVRS